MNTNTAAPIPSFTRYQIFMIAILSFLQFTVILDFMVLSPLGVILLNDLQISPEQFSRVVSGYAISAGLSGLLAAGFADKFDRKKLLLFFYAGFIVGTMLCALANSYHFLLIARIVTGIFGGVISAIGFAIITDLFAMNVRGRVMGFVQASFAASQVLGIPTGLLLANHFGWNMPFWMIVVLSVIAGLFILFYMKPIDAHLSIKSERNPVQHLLKTITTPAYIKGFLATTLLATGGFMLMPFGSTFSTNNLGLSTDELPILYGVTGAFSVLIGPLAGKLSDRIGKYKVFVMGSLVSLIMILIYTHLGITPLWLAIIINVCLFAGITARMSSASALTSALPAPQDRGAFMSINSSAMQLSGGIASIIAGMIVVQTSKEAPLQHYDLIGYVSIAAIVIVIGLMYIVHLQVQKNNPAQPVKKL